MGSWGYGVREDDFVCDVIGAFEDRLKEGSDVAAATAAVKSQYAGALADPTDGPLFWIALAEMQWTYGALDPVVLKQVTDDFHSGRSLLAWEEDQRALRRRKAVLARFTTKIEAPNPRPRKRPKTFGGAPKFQPGDCLSVELMDGGYAAAIVLAADRSTDESASHLVGRLDYRSAHKPTIEVFQQRSWLLLHGHSSNRQPDVAWYLPVAFRKAMSRLEVVGRVEIRDSDPRESNTYHRWARIVETARGSPAQNR